MNKSPAFQWYPKDILASARVQEMSLAEEGAYRRLLDFCWLNGSIPADEKRVARLIGKGATVEIARICMEMFTVDPNDHSRLIHDRLEEERLKQEAKSQARREASEARWSKRGTSAIGRGKQVNTGSNAESSQSQSNCNANAIQLQSIASSSSSSSSPPSVGEGAPARARGMPVEEKTGTVTSEWFLVTKALKIWGEFYPGITLDEQVVRDFARALPDSQLVEEVFRQTVSDWRLSRYKATNFADIVDRYRKNLKRWRKEQEENPPPVARDGGAAPSLVEQCDECDSRGQIEVERGGVKGMTKCPHAKLKAKLEAEKNGGND